MPGRVTLLVGVLLAATVLPCLGVEFSGRMGVEGRGFSASPLYAGQRDHDASVHADFELYHEFDSGSSVNFKPFVRLDSADDERTHADIRELNVLYVGNDFEARIGVSKVFWGSCEFVHLVDVINQTDLVESLDGEEKLGQPMLQFSFIHDWGVVETFLLPYFRERTYPGGEGRLRLPFVVDSTEATYESGAEEYHLDVALRYSHTLMDMDFGLYYFQGTSREPLLSPLVKQNEIRLVPYYEQMAQFGLDLQYVTGRWLWKMEALYRSGQGRSFSAAVGGVEYTLVGLFDSSMDLGLIGEYVFDDRQDTYATVYDNDVMFGVRLAVNDLASSEFLLGLVKDTRSRSLMTTFEASRRLTDWCTLDVSAVVFNRIVSDDVAYVLREDDFIKVEAIFYF